MLNISTRGYSERQQLSVWAFSSLARKLATLQTLEKALRNTIVAYCRRAVSQLHDVLSSDERTSAPSTSPSRSDTASTSASDSKPTPSNSSSSRTPTKKARNKVTRNNDQYQFVRFDPVAVLAEVYFFIQSTSVFCFFICCVCFCIYVHRFHLY